MDKKDYRMWMKKEKLHFFLEFRRRELLGVNSMYRYPDAPTSLRLFLHYFLKYLEM